MFYKYLTFVGVRKVAVAHRSINAIFGKFQNMIAKLERSKNDLIREINGNLDAIAKLEADNKLHFGYIEAADNLIMNLNSMLK